MRKIDTLTQLRAERKQLRNDIKRLENNMKTDAQHIRTSLEPVNLVFNGLGKTFGRDKQNLFNETVNVGIDVLIRKILFRNSNLIIKWLLPFFAKNLTSNYITDHKTDILGWLRKGVGKFFNKNGDSKHYDRSTADIDAATW